MNKKYPTLMHEWFEEVWNRRNAGTIERLLAADAIVHGITDESGKELRGPKAFKKFHSRFLNAFPNLSVKVEDTVSDGDQIAARCVVRGKHDGDGLGFKEVVWSIPEPFHQLCCRGPVRSAVRRWRFQDAAQMIRMHTFLLTGRLRKGIESHVCR